MIIIGVWGLSNISIGMLKDRSSVVLAILSLAQLSFLVLNMSTAVFRNKEFPIYEKSLIESGEWIKKQCSQR